MSPNDFYFSSESVTAGHPDKICDNVSDAILDECMRQDPMSRVACECAVNTGFILVMGEITTNAIFDYREIVRETIKDIGYNHPDYGYDGENCGVLISLDKQSPDISGTIRCGIQILARRSPIPAAVLAAVSHLPVRKRRP